MPLVIYIFCTISNWLFWEVTGLSLNCSTSVDKNSTWSDLSLLLSSFLLYVFYIWDKFKKF